MNKLFVYGTLVGQYENAEKAKLTNARKTGLAVEPDSDSEVEGEVIEVSDQELERLDRYEGTPTNYKRYRIQDDIEIYIANSDFRNLKYNFDDLDNEFSNCEIRKIEDEEEKVGEQVPVN